MIVPFGFLKYFCGCRQSGLNYEFLWRLCISLFPPNGHLQSPYYRGDTVALLLLVLLVHVADTA